MLRLPGRWRLRMFHKGITTNSRAVSSFVLETALVETKIIIMSGNFFFSFFASVQMTLQVFSTFPAS